MSSEDDDAAMPYEAVARCEKFIIEGRVEIVAREISAERAAALDRPHRPAGGRSAADVLDDLAEGQAEGGLEKAAVANIARDLQWHGAARAAHSMVDEIEPRSRIVGARRATGNIIDDGGALKQALMRRQRRLGANDAALAFEAFEKGGLLAEHRRRRPCGFRCRRRGRSP